MPALVWTLDPAELSPVVGNRNVFRAFLGLLPTGSSSQEKEVRKWMHKQYKIIPKRFWTKYIEENLEDLLILKKGIEMPYLLQNVRKWLNDCTDKN